LAGAGLGRISEKNGHIPDMPELKSSTSVMKMQNFVTMLTSDVTGCGSRPASGSRTASLDELVSIRLLCCSDTRLKGDPSPPGNWK